MSQNIKYDLSWGNPYFLMELLHDMYEPDENLKCFVHNIRDMSYAPDAGVPELVEKTKKIVKQVTSVDYKHIIITNGGTHAINTILRWYRSKGFEKVVTPPYGYPFYGLMIERAGLKRVEDIKLGYQYGYKFFRLIDSPGNPLGLQYGIGDTGCDGCHHDVWDSVYHSKIYTDNLNKIPNHNFMVGSYSKLLGLTGARVGFIALNDDKEYAELTDWASKDNATISVPSQDLILDIIDRLDLDKFLNRGRKLLDNNRSEIQKLEHIFDDQPIQTSGMFYTVKCSPQARELLNKCGVATVDLGNNMIRISLGQTNKITKNAVKAILKGDKDE